MPEPFPSIKDGDALTPAHLNMIYRELDRWRKLSGSGLIGLDNIDGKEPPMIMDWRTSDVVPADSGSGFTAGSRSSPTSTTVTLLSPSSGGPGLTATNGRTVKAYNTFTTAIAAGKTIWLTFSWGRYYVHQVDC
jgi:hypothetical protein